MQGGDRPLGGAGDEAHTGATFGVLLTVAYDGQDYSGFARQPNARTIAGELDGAVRAIDAHASLVRGASRTDAGVHALGQRVAFDTRRDLEARRWVGALNAELPGQIAVRRAARIAAGYEPRFGAEKKIYRYLVLEGGARSPFHEGRAWRVPRVLDLELMQKAAEPLAGQHDFGAFRSAADERSDTVRKLFRIEVRRTSSDHPFLPEHLEVVVEGTGFLHNMVRILVGSLVDVGRGRLDPAALERALATRERAGLGITAPPDGLYLDSIVLDDDGRAGWP